MHAFDLNSKFKKFEEEARTHNNRFGVMAAEGSSISFSFTIVPHIQLDETLLSSRNKLVH